MPRFAAAGLERNPIKCTLAYHSINGCLGSLSRYQKNLRYVRWWSGMANWWNMFSMSAVTACGCRRNLRRTPRKELLRSGPFNRVSLIQTPAVLTAESKTILDFPFCHTENNGIQYAVPFDGYASFSDTCTNLGVSVFRFLSNLSRLLYHISGFFFFRLSKVSAVRFRAMLLVLANRGLSSLNGRGISIIPSVRCRVLIFMHISMQY